MLKKKVAGELNSNQLQTNTDADSPQLSQSLKQLLSHLNPAYLFSKIREDITLIKQSKNGLKDPESEKDSKLIEAVLMGRIGVAFAASEVAAIVCAPIAGTAAQYLFGEPNATRSIMAAVAFDFIAAVVAFQATWISVNKGYYKDKAQSAKQNLINWAKDAAPLHTFCAVAALPVYAAVSGITKLVSMFGNSVSNNLGDIIPTALYAMPIALVLGEALWAGIFASFANNYVKKVQPRYVAYLKHKNRIKE